MGQETSSEHKNPDFVEWPFTNKKRWSKITNILQQKISTIHDLKVSFYLNL